MEIKTLIVLVMFYGLTFLFLDISGLDLKRSELITKRDDPVLTPLSKKDATNNKASTVSNSVEVIPEKPIILSKIATSPTATQPLKTKVEESNSSIKKRSNQKSTNQKVYRHDTSTDDECIHITKHHTAEDNDNDDIPSYRHPKHTFFEETDGTDIQKSKKDTKILESPDLSACISHPNTVLSSLRNKENASKSNAKNKTKETIIISPEVRTVHKNGTKVRTRTIEVHENPCTDNLGHDLICNHTSIQSDDKHNEPHTSTEVCNVTVHEIPHLSNSSHTTIVHIPLIKDKHKSVVIDMPIHRKPSNLPCSNNIDQKLPKEDNAVTVDNVYITNSDADEVIERFKCPDNSAQNTYTGTNVGNQGYQYGNQNYAQGCTPQYNPFNMNGGIQYYPVTESYPITNVPCQDSQFNMHYKPTTETVDSFLKPYQYPFAKQLQDYLTPEIYQQQNSKPYVETIEIDPQKLICSNKAYPKSWRTPPRYYYSNGRYNYNMHPPRKYSYSELIVPNRYKDRIWRSWRKTEVTIKGRNRTEPFQIALDRGNWCGDVNSLPPKYDKRNPLICLNGYYGNQNTPFYMRYTN